MWSVVSVLSVSSVLFLKSDLGEPLDFFFNVEMNLLQQKQRS